ncbi:MAG: RecX family transcriptional regulator [Peptoniphilus sp.]|nr:RecX family transcriptional regulator [Peptoniphilus sp.]MDD7363337.1 RecX family transcriptional regulator [Bacillota bacterium]MDY6044256.1 RecX family transcriptional regulator [Peptoniphilus sp.]
MNILRIRKSNHEYIVEIEGRDPLSLKESVFVRHNLYKGKAVTDDDIATIVADAERQEAIDVALRKLRNRKTEHEIRSLLSREGFDDTSIDAAVDYLEDYRLIDDEEYALLYARDKRHINGYGPVKIAYFLKRKGVDDDHIERALADYDDDEERRLILQLIEKKYVRGGELTKEVPKIIRFLLSRGFHYEAIKAVLSAWD